MDTLPPEMLFGLAKGGAGAAKGLLAGAFPKLKAGGAGRPSSMR